MKYICSRCRKNDLEHFRSVPNKTKRYLLDAAVCVGIRGSYEITPALIQM
jgi:hypothetical protein